MDYIFLMWDSEANFSQLFHAGNEGRMDASPYWQGDHSQRGSRANVNVTQPQSQIFAFFSFAKTRVIISVTDLSSLNAKLCSYRNLRSHNKQQQDVSTEHGITVPIGRHIRIFFSVGHCTKLLYKLLNKDMG